jgi:hypothetical protein
MAAGILSMFHIGRAGSTVLGDMLNQHPSIGWDSEIYATKRRLWLGQGDPVALVQRRATLLRKRWYGFEVKAFHVRLIGWTLGDLVDAYRAGGPARFMVLRRENTLRKIVSTAVARVTGRFHLAGQSAAPPVPAAMVRVRIDPHAHFIDGETRPLVEFLESFDRFHGSLDEILASDDPLRLSYEADILGDPQRAYRATCRWLGEEPVPVVMRFARTTPFPLREVIENYDDVARALEGTRWAWMLGG